MMELAVNGKVAIVTDDNNKDVIFDKRIIEELNKTTDANGNKVEFTEEIKD